MNNYSFFELFIAFFIISGGFIIFFETFKRSTSFLFPKLLNIFENLIYTYQPFIHSSLGFIVYYFKLIFPSSFIDIFMVIFIFLPSIFLPTEKDKKLILIRSLRGLFFLLCLKILHTNIDVKTLDLTNYLNLPYFLLVFISTYVYVEILKSLLHLIDTLELLKQK